MEIKGIERLVREITPRLIDRLSLIRGTPKFVLNINHHSEIIQRVLCNRYEHVICKEVFSEDKSDWGISLFDPSFDIPLLKKIIQHTHGLIGVVFLGGDSFFELKHVLATFDELRWGGIAVRFYPLFSPRSFAGALQILDLSYPIVDYDRIEITYPSLQTLLCDLRRSGMRYALPRERILPLCKSDFVTLDTLYRDIFGEIRLTLDVVYGVGQVNQANVLPTNPGIQGIVASHPA